MARRAGGEDEGDNGPAILSDDEVAGWLRRLLEARAVLAAAKAVHDEVRAKARGEGIKLRQMDQIMKMMDWETDEVRDHFATSVRYAKLAALPIGHQFDLFDEAAEDPIPTLVRDKQLAHDAGYRAGLSGKPGTPPEEIAGEFIQDWQAGWNDGQAKNAPRKLRTSPVVAPAHEPDFVE